MPRTKTETSARRMGPGMPEGALPSHAKGASPSLEKGPLPSLSKGDLARMHARAGEAAALMKALSNESRLLILCTLAGTEMSVSELNERIPLSQSALSQQLAVLRREGLVRTRREAQTIYYSLVPSDAVPVIEVLQRIYCPSPRSRR